MPGFIITSHRVIGVEDVATIRLLPDFEQTSRGIIRIITKSEPDESCDCASFANQEEAALAFSLLRLFVKRVVNDRKFEAFDLQELSTYRAESSTDPFVSDNGSPLGLSPVHLR